MKKLKTIIKRIVYGKFSDSKSYVKYLRKIGCRIGNGTSFINPRSTMIDETRPWMVSIGEGCCITSGVTILTHDYGWSVVKAQTGEIIGSVAPVSIGNHVYIGMHTTILAGVSIGDNVIIGANSLVSKSIPSNSVVAGNPARIIRSIAEYREKRKNNELNEAVVMVQRYREVYKKDPPIQIMREHFWLFESDYSSLIPEFKDVMNLVYGSHQKSINAFGKHKKQFYNYEDFLKYCDNWSSRNSIP